MTVGESMQSIEDQYHLDAFMGQDLYNTTSTAEFDAFHEDVMERMDARYKTPFFRRLLKEENWEVSLIAENLFESHILTFNVSLSRKNCCEV
jgi:methenyltetrahydromethanopterin cyclohydrolase